MIKKYDFYYEAGKYILKYNNPNTTTEPFEINGEDMQFDTKTFYLYMFSDIKENLHIEITNKMNVENTVPHILKKGERVYRVIDELCKEITSRINKQCFVAKDI